MGYDLDWVRSSERESENPFKSEDYFRIGTFSMPALRDAMETRGMGHWLRPSDLLNTGDTAFRVPGARGVPLTKLSSNDGWLVLPEEIREALVANDALPAATDGDFKEGGGWDAERWEAWIAFLRGAAEHEGFKVL